MSKKFDQTKNKLLFTHNVIRLASNSISTNFT
jgi:hypothetical protein